MAGTEEELDINNLSDEEFLALSQEEQEALNGVDEDDSNDEGNDQSSDASDEDDNLEENDNADEEEEDDAEHEEFDSADDSSDSGDGDADESDNDSDDSSSDDSDSGDDSKDNNDSGEVSEAEFAQIGRQIMGEIKANGSTLKIKSAEDAIQLIQMGANYHQKMKGLKPSIKMLKLLENNGLLDPTKLNYLIDLHQKKPEAITQLLKDSKIDPMDIDLAGEETYAPEQRTVNDKELVLEDVLEGIKGNSTYQKTLTVIGDDWDEASRTAILADPVVIRTINGHMESGIYDQVADAVAYQRTLGKLQGVSDFDAYQQMGNYMMEKNLFTSNAAPTSDAQGDQGSQLPGEKKETAAQKQARLDKKKGASPSRRKKAPKKSEKDFNPLGMSDEDFAKHTNLSY